MNFEEKTSVRVNQTPGGSSSMNLGWSENTIYTAGSNILIKSEVNRNESNIVFNDGSKEPLIERRNLTAVVDPTTYKHPTKTPVGGKSTFSLGGEGPSYKPTNRVPPGGKTTFTLG